MRSPINSGVNINNYFDTDLVAGQKTLYNCSVTTGVTSPNDGHKGVDFPVPLDTPIVTAAAGKIYQLQNTCANVGSASNTCGDGIGLGNHYKIDHAGDNADGQGLATLYLHLRDNSVTLPPNTPVSCGQQLAMSAQSGQVTGAHLHFGLRANGSDPNVKIDPYEGQCSHPGTKYWNALTTNNQPSTICQTAPSTPTNIAIVNPTASSLQITFTDTAVNESQIIVERKIGSTGSWATRAVFNALTGTQGWSWVDSGLTTNQMYCYRMRALNGGGYSAYSSETCGTAQNATLPPAPSAVTVNNATVSSLRINFTDNASNETAILLERRNGTGAWTQIANFGALTGTQGWYWDNTGLTSGQTYCYRLRAQNGSGYSTYSNEACGTTSGGTSGIPPAPSNVYVTNATTNSLQVNFTDNATNETSTRIERKIGPGAWGYFGYFSPLTGASSWNWVNTGLGSKTTYCYRLYASNAAGNSPNSNEACGTTL